MDLDLWLKLARDRTPNYLPVCLSALRQHDDAKTLRDNTRAMHEVERVLRRHWHGRPGRVVARSLRNIRRLQARGHGNAALAAYYEHARGEMSHELGRAVKCYPPSITSLEVLRVALRATLPAAAKARLFAKP